MRILFVGPFGFHPNKTMQARAFSLARELVKRGHQLKILMPPWQTPEEAGRSWVEEGVEIEYISLAGGMLGIWWRMMTFGLAWQPDIIHGFKPKAYSGLMLTSLWASHRKKIKLLCDTDDWEGWGGWNELGRYSTAEKYFFAWQERWGLTHAHGVTVASRSLESLVWSLGVEREKLFYLPNGPGIRLNEDQAVEKEFDLILYSRLFEFDIARFIRILEKVVERVGLINLLFIGTALYEDDQKKLEEGLKRVGLFDQMRQLGWVPLEQLPTYLKKGKTAVYLMDDHLLNRTKCPVKLIDLLSLGIPVVGENVGEVAVYIKHEQNGLLYQSGDEVGVAIGISALLQDEEKRTRLALGAEAQGIQYRWEKRAIELEKIYEQLL